MAPPTSLPLPAFFDPIRVGEVWRVPYQQRAADAKAWSQQHQISPAATDLYRVCLLLIDVQNTFCIPEFELFVGGRSGRGAVDDNRRLCEFIYRNLGIITTIAPTLDTHTALQIFHAEFWQDGAGHPPAPMTMITAAAVAQGEWRVNPAIVASLGNGDYHQLQAYARHYTQQLDKRGKFPLTIWPYHSMLGGIGHALVAAVEEACFVHNLARSSQTQFELKGSHPLTENYSVLSPEVTRDQQGQTIASPNHSFLQTLLEFDAVIVAGQAKSHCVAWTVADLLAAIQQQEPTLAGKIYLLEDCMSPVVVPGVVDFTEQAEQSFDGFAQAGMHRVRSTTPLSDWPGFTV